MFYSFDKNWFYETNLNLNIPVPVVIFSYSSFRLFLGAFSSIFIVPGSGGRSGSGSRMFPIMQIRADPDPHHWFKFLPASRIKIDEYIVNYCIFVLIVAESGTINNYLQHLIFTRCNVAAFFNLYFFPTWN